LRKVKKSGWLVFGWKDDGRVYLRESGAYPLCFISKKTNPNFMKSYKKSITALFREDIPEPVFVEWESEEWGEE